MQTMVNLNFDDLRLFARVAALGTLSAAARERNVPVSQISRTLQRVEAAYGAKLMHRSTHGLSLTPEGSTIYAHALHIVDEIDAIDADLGRNRNSATGLVRVSMSTVMAQHLLVNSLPSLMEKHPGLLIDLRVDDTAIDMVREGIDIAIRTGEPSNDGLIMRNMGNLYRRLYASPGYLAHHGTPQTPKDLEDHVLIAHSRHAYLNQWPLKTATQNEGAPCVIRASGPLSTDNSATMTAMALADLGIARLISVIEPTLVAQGQLQRVLADFELDTPVAINAFMLNGRHRLPKIRACIDHWAQWLQTTPSPC
jgi:DNA-binding transcriptional LysR family regulator